MKLRRPERSVNEVRVNMTRTRRDTKGIAMSAMRPFGCGGHSPPHPGPIGRGPRGAIYGRGVGLSDVRPTVAVKTIASS